MFTSTRFQPRPYAGDADIEAIRDFLNMIEIHDQIDEGIVDTEDLRSRFSSPEHVLPRDIRLWEDENSRLVGFGELWFHKPEGDKPTDCYLYMRVHPEARNQGLEEEMFDWATEQARSVAAENGGGGYLRTGIQYNSAEFAAYRQDVLERNGFTPVRYWFKMARDLSEPLPDAPLPEGYALRHTEGIADAEKWVDAFNNSFIDHWNHHKHTVENHVHWLETDSSYDKERDLVAVAPDGTWAAFCFCMIYAKDNQARNIREGWIDMLGTRRGYRKMGLGTGMLVAGMRKLKEAGMDTAVLGVDAENPTGALHLYESVGFKQMHRQATYTKDL